MEGIVAISGVLSFIFAIVFWLASIVYQFQDDKKFLLYSIFGLFTIAYCVFSVWYVETH